MRQTPRGRLHAARVDTVRLGAKRAPTPAVSDMRGTWKPRRGPLVLLVRAGGGLTVREAEFPGGTGRLKKRRLVGRKARGTTTGWGGASPPQVAGNPPDTGRGDRARKGADVGWVSL